MTPTETPTTQAQTGIELAVAKAGSQTALAQQLISQHPHKPHPSQQVISQWVKRGYVPPSRAKEIADVSGVPVAQLLSPTLRQLVHP